MLDIWIKIYKHLIFIDRTLGFIIRPVPNRESLRAYNYVIARREFDKRCVLCGDTQLITYCNVDWTFPRTSFWKKCAKCVTYYNICECNTYRNLISFHGNVYTNINAFNPWETRPLIDDKIISNTAQESRPGYKIIGNAKYFPECIAPLHIHHRNNHNWECRNINCKWYETLDEY